MAQAKVTDVSSLSGLEKFVETFKKEFPKTKSKVKIYLSELKDCFTKVCIPKIVQMLVTPCIPLCIWRFQQTEK